MPVAKSYANFEQLSEPFKEKGKMYIKVKGTNGIKSATKKVEILVSDTIPPTVSISGNLPQSLKKGDTLTIPTIIVSDDNSQDVYTMTYVMEPSGKIVMVENGYQTWTTGRHTFWVYASDEFGNVTMKDFIFYVV